MMEKICKKCGLPKNIDLFSKNKNNKDGFQNYCKICKSNNDRTSNIKNWESLKSRNQLKIHKKSIIRDDWKITLGGKCKKCNDNRLYVLDFHHLEEHNKVIDISTLIGHVGDNNPRIKEEVEKCILLCSNCHREFHYLERSIQINIKDYIK